MGYFFSCVVSSDHPEWTANFKVYWGDDLIYINGLAFWSHCAQQSEKVEGHCFRLPCKDGCGILPLSGCLELIKTFQFWSTVHLHMLDAHQVHSKCFKLNLLPQISSSVLLGHISTFTSSTLKPATFGLCHDYDLPNTMFPITWTSQVEGSENLYPLCSSE